MRHCTHGELSCVTMLQGNFTPTSMRLKLHEILNKLSQMAEDGNRAARTTALLMIIRLYEYIMMLWTSVIVM